MSINWKRKVLCLVAVSHVLVIWRTAKYPLAAPRQSFILGVNQALICSVKKLPYDYAMLYYGACLKCKDTSRLGQ
jgi:hypothetical protein